MNKSRYLAHHGIKGQQWGNRRFQNEDGSLTPEGKERYSNNENIKQGSINDMSSGRNNINNSNNPKSNNENNNPGSINIDMSSGRNNINNSNNPKSNNENNKDKDKNNDNNKKPTVTDAINNGAKVGQAFNSLSSQIHGPEGHKEYAHYPNMTDEEIQRNVNRLRNEQALSDLRGDTKFVKSGEQKAREMLQTIGAIAALGLTVAQIIAIYKQKKSS